MSINKLRLTVKRDVVELKSLAIIRTQVLCDFQFDQNNQTNPKKLYQTSNIEK